MGGWWWFKFVFSKYHMFQYCFLKVRSFYTFNFSSNTHSLIHSYIHSFFVFRSKVFCVGQCNASCLGF